MPATRKSVATPVRATRSHGTINETAQQKVKTVRSAKQSHHVVDNTGPAPTVQRKPKAPVDIQTPGKSSIVKAGGVRNVKGIEGPVDTEDGMTDSPGRPKVTGPQLGTLSQHEDSFSPRRSSRAVVPNSRFKDMEMLGSGRKRPADKEKEKANHSSRKKDRAEPVKKKGKIEVLSQAESQVIMEEVVTEETHIDTIAQMSMFDELLVPTVSVPSVSVPTVSVPSVSVPPVSVPTVSVPVVHVPTVSVPSLSLSATCEHVPDISSSATSVSSISSPDTNTPAASVPVVSVSNIILADESEQHALSTSSASSPAASSPVASSPAGSIATVAGKDSFDTEQAVLLTLENSVNVQTINTDTLVVTNTEATDEGIPESASYPNTDSVEIASETVVEEGNDLIVDPEVLQDVLTQTVTVEASDFSVPDSGAAVDDNHVDEHVNIQDTPTMDQSVGATIMAIEPAVTSGSSSSIVVTAASAAETGVRQVVDSKTVTSPQVIVIPPISQKVLNISNMKTQVPIASSVPPLHGPGKQRVVVSSGDTPKQKIIYVGPHNIKNKMQKMNVSSADIVDKANFQKQGLLKTELSRSVIDASSKTTTVDETKKRDKDTVINILTATSVNPVSASSQSVMASTSPLKQKQNVVYVKAKPKSDQPGRNLRYEIIRMPPASTSRSHVSSSTRDSTVIYTEPVTTVDSSEINLECAEQLDCYSEVTGAPSMETSDTSTLSKMLNDETTVNIPQATDVNESHDDTEKAMVTELDETIILAGGDGSGNLGTGYKQKPPGEKLRTSFCQVIEYERHKELLISKTQTAIEYVMFGNTMVPIHKPYSPSHSRQQGARLGSTSHGRVELPGKGKKSLSTGTVDGHVAQVSKEVQIGALGVGASIDQSISATQEETVIDGEIQVSQSDSKVVQGYIDYTPGRALEPTQVVEISQDLFTKEVYGDSLILDPVTGEMVPVPSMEMTSTEPYTADLQGTSKELVQQAGHELTNETSVNTATVSSVSVTEVVSPDKQTVTTVTGPTEAACSDQISLDTDLNMLVTQATSADTENYVVVTMATTNETSQNAVTMAITEEVPKDLTPESVVIHIPQEEVIAGTQPTVSNVTGSRGTVSSLGANVIELVDVKFVPGKSTTTQPEVEAVKPGVLVTRQAAGLAKTQVTTGSQTVTMATKTQEGATSRSEIQTQTEEIDDDEEDDDDEEEDEEEDGFEVTSSQTVVVRNEDRLKLGTDGPSSHEYVVVHLPEGTEIKQHHTRTVVRDPMRDEVVTMTPEGLYVCVDCNHKTDKKSNWYKHRRKHLGIRPHSCTQCSYKAATSSNLKRHMQIHDDVRNFSCSICGLMFRQKIHLERHIKYKHQEKNVKCPLCDYLCANENPDLKIHIRRRHVPQDGSMSAFSCPQCGLMTVSKKDLKQHMKFHKKGPELKLFCEYCSFVTDCESRLRRHVLVHTKERPFQCGLCSYRASQKEHVLRHMRTQHDIEVERKKKQGMVVMKDKRRRSLLEGLHFTPKDINDDSSDTEKAFERSDYSCTEKIFACNHCTMKFAKLINLYKHLYAQHKQVMPDLQANDFQCVVCEFKTNSKKNLLVHMRKHNMQDHNPPSHVYSCVLCRYINPRRRNLFQHMKKKHGIEIMMKEDGMNCYVTSDNSTLILSQNKGETSEMALSDIVHTQALDDDSELHIVTDTEGEFHAEKISIDNIIAVEDINSYVSTDDAGEVLPHAETVVVNTLQSSSVPTHEAAEAIEGLQALAQQSVPLDITEMVPSDILTEAHIVGMDQLVGESEQEGGGGIQLSTDQLNQLSSGDYVEINGEVYKVEIAQEPAVK